MDIENSVKFYRTVFSSLEDLVSEQRHSSFLPSILIANLVAARRLPIKKSKLFEILTQFSHMERELSTQFDINDTEKALSFLVDEGLIDLNEDSIKALIDRNPALEISN